MSSKLHKMLDTFNTQREMNNAELVEWLKEYRLNLMSLMGQDDYVTGKLDVIKDVLDKCNTKEK